MTTLYAVAKFTPDYPNRIVAVFAEKQDADKFADYENLAHDYSSFSVVPVIPSTIKGITCILEGATYLIRGVKI